MKTKILMLVGIAVSVIFLSSSAFAVSALNLTTEQIDRGNYVEIVIRAGNPSADVDYDQVGIKEVEKSILLDDDSDGIAEDIDKVTTTVDGYTGVIPRQIKMNHKFNDELLGYRISEITECNTDNRVTTGRETRYEPSGELVGLETFSRVYNENGQIISTEVVEYNMDGEEMVHISTWYLNLNIPAQPLYVLREVPHSSTVDLGSIFLQKPMEGETIPVQRFDILVADNEGSELGVLEDYEVALSAE